MGYINFINGTSEDLTATSSLGVDVALGTSQRSDYNNENVDHDYLGKDQKLGLNGSVPNANLVAGDRIASLPSGYDAYGVPTYGDGQSVSLTDYKDDHEHVGQGEFNYAHPNGPINKHYSDLTS